MKPMPYNVLVNTLKGWVRKMGMDPNDVSGHSLRRGGATYAMHCGVPTEVIKAQGDWASDCYLLYCIIPPSRLLEVSDAMGRAMERGDFGAESWDTTNWQAPGQ